MTQEAKLENIHCVKCKEHSPKAFPSAVICEICINAVFQLITDIITDYSEPDSITAVGMTMIIADRLGNISELLSVSEPEPQRTKETDVNLN